MDRFRSEDRALREHVEQRARGTTQHARWFAFGFVVCSAPRCSRSGWSRWSARRGATGSRAKQRREYVEALHGADDEARPRTCCAGGPSG